MVALAKFGSIWEGQNRVIHFLIFRTFDLRYNVPQEQKNRIVNSWDDFFSAIFQGKTFSDIQKSRVYVKRTLPILHSQNKTWVELALPYQFGFDSNGERWF